MTMTENPPEPDNQAVPKEEAETAPKVEEDELSPESVEPTPVLEETTPQEPKETEVVEVEQPEESAP